MYAVARLMSISSDSLLQFTTSMNIEQSELRWYGHVKRMTGGRTAERWLQWTPQFTDHTTTWTDVLGDAGRTASNKPQRDPGEVRCRTLSRRTCSSTDENGDTSSLTGLRPTWINVVQVLRVDEEMSSCLTGAYGLPRFSKTDTDWVKIHPEQRLNSNAQMVKSLS